MSTRAPARPEALVAGAAALVAIAGAALTLFFALELSVAGLAWVGTAATVGLAPALAVAALVTLLARRAVLSPRRAAGVAALAALACASALGAALSWSAGFDAADAGFDAAPHTRVTLLTAVAAWVLGAAAIAALTAAVLPGPRVPSARWLLALLIGAVGSPIVGAALLAPATTVIASFALLVLAIRPRALPVERPARGVPVASRPRPVPVVPARALAWSAAAAGALAIALALTGSTWGVVILDATQTMQLGMAVGNLCALPLVLSLDLVLASRNPGRRALIHLVAALVAVALVVAAAAPVAGLLGDSFWQWQLLMLSVGVTAVAGALTVGAALPGGRGVRALLAVAAGAAFAVTFGVVLMAAAPFLAPPLAAGWALWGVRRRARPPQDRVPAGA
ncbi:hypothetical protein [Naasia sp. SYSU D00057]|uniref:hypothetical protein n=1 Tax=Naasia sp. SYSU D00057 TaxID=2817380 RepID=UPI001B30D0C7|nr:hypothetical protein [Naasia sp. SYSU D00057]